MTSVQRGVAEIWSEVLGIALPGLDDNFFQLGGHSLLITQMAARLTVACGTDIGVPLIHTNPVLRDLCDAIENRRSTGSREPGRRPAETVGAVLREIPPCPVTRLWDEPLDLAVLDGRLAPIDAAAVTYVPQQWLRDKRLPETVWCEEFDAPGAHLAHIYDTTVGRIGMVVAPIGSAQLYEDPDRTAAVTRRAVARAAALGARAVSLTGLLPSATAYGRAVVTGTDDLSGMSAGPADILTLSTGESVTVTTGHAVTAAAVTLTTVDILRRLGRDIAAETLCVLGVGSIGTSSLRLLVGSGHHPARVVLCDLHSRRGTLDEEIRTLRGLGYHGDITVAGTRGTAPAAVYEAGVILGAVSVPDVLDVDTVKSGTVVVDDSFPRCFDADRAVRRMSEHGDALFIEGGLVRAPDVLDEVRYLPDWLKPLVGEGPPRRLAHELMGCVAASGLVAAHPDIAVSIGPVTPARAAAGLERLSRLGFSAAAPQCHGYEVLDAVLDRMRGLG